MNQITRDTETAMAVKTDTVRLDLPGFAPVPENQTPAGLQDSRTIATRRVIFVAINLATLAALTWGIAMAFSAGGWSVSDVIIMCCFLVGAPWTVMGLWNALFGIWLLHGRKDGMRAVAPHLDAMENTGPLTTRTALAMTVRNEDPRRSFELLVEMRRSLDATGHGAHFDVFILSDTTDPKIAEQEEVLFAQMRSYLGGDRATYRRRTVNTAFKAGNVRDFLLKQGRDFDLYLPLDSDSLMSGPAIVRMVRVMEAYPRIGILQSLVVGAPAQSAFARIFQFGMRHGMRSYTMGATWWQADCGPYWGHNALIRIRPFRMHCRLPVLPGKAPLGGHILSHDQVEAALMRRAGYEVRVMPVETESWEDNPPTLMDFTKRDLRWCQGNMQYWPLLKMKGLRPTSRFQIFAAIMMYFGAPAWMLMTVAAASKLFEGGAGGIDLAFGIAMFFIMFAVSLIPKLMGLLDVALTPGGSARYGGRMKFAISGFVEAIMSILMAPIVAFRVTVFLIGLACGKSIIWGAQNRDAYSLSWGDAWRGLWMQTVFGKALLIGILVFAGASTLPWAMPMITGLCIAVPFAVLTASPAFGRWSARVGLCTIPEEISPPDSIRRLHVAEQSTLVEPTPQAA